MNSIVNFARRGVAVVLLTGLAVTGATAAPLEAAGRDTSADVADAPPSARAVEAARRAVHLLEYIAVDYPAAVDAGRIVSRLEYDEQIAFLGDVGAQLTALEIPASDPLRTSLAALVGAVEARAAAADVAERARALSGDLRLRFDVQAMPPRPPSLERGRTLYAAACASCHGASGRGDGPQGVELDPAPSDFTDRERMLALPLSAVFATITYGISGTGMASFADAFDDGARYDLAFYVGSLAFGEDEVGKGAEIAALEPDALAAHVTGLSPLISEPAVELAGPSAQGRALVAYARTHPEALMRSGVSFAVVNERLEQSWRAYEDGDPQRAAELAVSAYLDGFEPLEPRLDTLDGEARIAVEMEFLRYRELLRRDASRDEVRAQRERLLGAVEHAEGVLAHADFGSAAAFVASLTILAREGFEAVLLILALVGIVTRAGRPEALRWVHAGWAAALAAGLLTWVAARRVVEISGAEREIVEGATSLIAAAVLFYVSYWLIAKVSSRRWQVFLRTRIESALTRGSLWTLAFISFVAVYREAFETVLFYEAIVAQAGPAGIRAIVLGALAGAAVLAMLVIAGIRYGRHLPVRRFFVVSSALLYALSVVLAGQGVAALQEAGWIPATEVPFVRIEWLGIHPTLESLGVQAALLLAAAAAGAWLLARHEVEPEPAADRARA